MSASAHVTRARPLVARLDIVLEEVEPGHAVFSTYVARSEPDACSTLLVLALSAAVQACCPDSGHRMLDLRHHDIRPGRVLSGRLVAVAEVVSRGGRLVAASGRVVDDRGRARAWGALLAAVSEEAG